MPTPRDDIIWSPRVPKHQLRRLYQQVAQGIWDVDLIDEVGTTLFCRCRDILRIHRAKTEHLITCARCDRRGVETLIPSGGGRDVPFTCPVCGWSMTWRNYSRTFKRRQLNPGGAVEFFEAYVKAYPRARGPREKVLAIDRLIHTFHYSLRDDPDRPTRPAGVNLISGKLADVVAFLDELSGLDLPPTMVQTGAAWREAYAGTYWPEYLQDQQEEEAGPE